MILTVISELTTNILFLNSINNSNLFSRADIAEAVRIIKKSPRHGINFNYFCSGINNRIIIIQPFFVISGFLLAHSFASKLGKNQKVRLKHFLIAICSRLLRIFSSFSFCCSGLICRLLFQITAAVCFCNITERLVDVIYCRWPIFSEIQCIFVRKSIFVASIFGLICCL